MQRMRGRLRARWCALWARWDERIRYLKSTGTRVKESTRLASSATITDTDSGEKRYFAVPCSRNTGTKTMQMQSVARKVGVPTSPAPSMIARSAVRPSDVTLDVLDDHRAVVDQDAHCEREAPERHGIEGLAAAVIASTAVITDSGIEARMMSVSRHLPRTEDHERRDRPP